MQIAYVANIPYLKGSGVSRKILDQTAVWENLGHTVHLYWLSEEKPPPCRRLRHYGGFSGEGRVRGIRSRLQGSLNLWRDLLREGPDVVYMRYEYYKPWMEQVLERIPSIIELNGLIVKQLMNLARERRSIRPAATALSFILTRKRMFGRAAGVALVADGLLEGNGITQFVRQAEVFPNSIDLSKESIVQSSSGNSDPRPVMLAAFAGKHTYNGVEQLIEFAGMVREELRLVLVAPEAARIRASENVTLMDVVSEEEFRSILGKVDIGIGPVECYKGGFDSASPLKIRSFLAAGLPVILPYSDVAFSEGAEVPWVLKIPNERDTLMKHKGEILDFCKRMKGVKVNRSEVRDLIDAGVIESRRLAFMERARANWFE